MKTTYKGKLYYADIDHNDHYDIDFIFYSRSQMYMTLDHVNRNEKLEFRGDRSGVYDEDYTDDDKKHIREELEKDTTISARDKEFFIKAMGL